MVEALTRARLEHFAAVLTAGAGADQALPPQLRYAIAGVRAYLAAAEDGAPVADQLRGNAVALWEILGAAVAKAPTGSESLPAPRSGPDARSAAVPAGAAVGALR